MSDTVSKLEAAPSDRPLRQRPKEPKPSRRRAKAVDAALQAGAASDDVDGRKLVAAGGAGLLAAAAALALSGANGNWSFGLTVAGSVLLLAAGAVFVMMARAGRTAHGIDRAISAALLETSSEALAVTDASGSLVGANNAYRRVCHGEVVAPQVLVDERDAAALGKLVDAAVGDGRARARLACRIAGKIRWLTLTARRSGPYLVWSTEASDLDRLTADVVREAEVRLAPILNRLDMGFAVTNVAGEVLFLNRVLARWLGEAEGQAPDRLDGLEEGLVTIATAGEETLEVETIKLSIPGPDNVGYLGVLMLVRNVTLDRQRHAERAEAPLIDALFDDAPVGIAAVDTDGRLVDFNESFVAFAPNRNARPGEPVANLVVPDDREALMKHIASAVAGEASQRPVDVRFNTQPERMGQVYFSRVDHPGAPSVVLYLVDTTQEKSLERQFVQAQKMQAVGQLAGGVAHDFNNLLTAIIGFCDLLLVRHGAGDQSFSDIMQIKQNANRAANLVRQLLAFSRQQTMRPKVLLVTDVLAELSNLIRRLIGENIELKMTHGRDLGMVKVDQGQLEQVIINMAVNARDAMNASARDGGMLSIRTRQVGADDPVVQSYTVMPPGDYVLIEVSDTGVGIPTENLNKVFEPFFTTKEVGQGTGLGLSTVYGIVKQTGGFVFVESEPGEGAVFRIYLPVHEDAGDQGQAAPEAAEAPARDLTGKGTILLVEDEDPVRMFAARALANKGYTVLEAASGEAGLDIVNTHDGTIDLLISDVVMPNMDGPTLVKKARGSRPDMNIIFISGYAEDVFRKNVDGDDFDDYSFLPKPFTLKQLAEQVKEVLG